MCDGIRVWYYVSQNFSLGCLVVWNPHQLCRLLSNRTFDRDKSISLIRTSVQLPRRQERTESSLTFPGRETGVKTLWLAAFPSGWLPSYIVRSSLLACRTAIWELSPDQAKALGWRRHSMEWYKTPYLLTFASAPSSCLRIATATFHKKVC